VSILLLGNENFIVKKDVKYDKNLGYYRRTYYGKA
jgi:hypothetical protein